MSIVGTIACVTEYVVDILGSTIVSLFSLMVVGYHTKADMTKVDLMNIR